MENADEPVDLILFLSIWTLKRQPNLLHHARFLKSEIQDQRGTTTCVTCSSSVTYSFYISEFHFCPYNDVAADAVLPSTMKNEWFQVKNTGWREVSFTR